MKPCRKCQKTLPLSSFYAHPQMADGHLNICKECHKSAVKAAYQKANGRVEYERERNRRPERKAAASRYSAARRGVSPEKYKARVFLNNAVRDGRAIRLPCRVCGDPKSQAHHDDYSKPLEVEWLCFRHHREIGHGQTIRSPT